MIIKMNKYDFLVYHAQYEHFLQRLQEVGVLHVVQRQEGVADNDEIRDKMLLKSRVAKAVNYCKNSLAKDAMPQPAKRLPMAEGLALLDEMERRLAEIEKIKSEIANTQREKERMDVWGNFSHDTLDRLEKNNFIVGFFSCAERKFQPQWEEQYNAFKIGTVGATLYFVTVTRQPVVDIEADAVALSDKNCVELEGELKQLAQNLTDEQNSLNEFLVANLENFNYLSLQLEETIDTELVHNSTLRAADNTVMILEGYCPEDSEVALKEMLDHEGVYYEVSNPTVDDDVPVKLKNNSFARLFEPITKLFSLPNYRELDVTPLMAPFFMLFFGLCLGDGGYGLLILVAATLFKKRLSPGMKPMATLAQWLGASTMVCGLATGAFFGIALDAVTWPWLAGVKEYFVTDNNYKEALGGYSPMMIFAVAIGLVQIFFGMGVNAAKIIKQHGVKYALAPIAWIVGLIGSAVALGLPMFGIALPAAVKYIFFALIGLSVLLILFYNSPDKYKSPVTGLFANVGSALWSAYNMATGLLGDTLSYIRLFALGLTGSILGGVFNTLALQFANDIPVPGLNWFVGLFILLFGHSINFGLCIIGALVHPLRLTFVEFYKNSGFEGGGAAYSPFRHKA